MTEATRVTGASIGISMMLRQSHGNRVVVMVASPRSRTRCDILIAQVEWIICGRHGVAACLESVLKVFRQPEWYAMRQRWW
jgi:copper oxidase (laccase) domain-containing protein